MSISITIPEKIVKKIRDLGLDLESLIIEALMKNVPMDPEEEVELHLYLSKRYLDEGKKMVSEDVVQSSEKLYKAAEEAIKAFAKHLKLKEVLSSVEKRGRWTVTDLEKAVREISAKMGEEILLGWGEANYLHVWGFHEAKLDENSVKTRIPYIEKMIEILEKVTK